MSRIPVATELGRRDRFWPAVLASIAVHGAAIVLAVKATSLPTIELEQTPIRARLVRLGEKKPEQLLPQKEAPPPSPAPAEPAPPAPEAPPAAPEPPSAPPAALAEGAMPAPPSHPAQPKPGPARPAHASPARNPANGGGSSSIDSLLAKATKDVERTRYGDPNGDPMGDSDEGTEGEKYDALVTRAIRANYRVPDTIPEKERLYLKTFVRIWVEPDGTISNWKLEKASGNPIFDGVVERAILAARLPPPPGEVRALYQGRGRTLTFDMSRN